MIVCIRSRIGEVKADGGRQYSVAAMADGGRQYSVAAMSERLN